MNQLCRCAPITAYPSQALRLNQLIPLWIAMLGWLAFSTIARCDDLPDPPSRAIAFDQIGNEAAKDYQGEGLSIKATPSGAHLRCDFQKISGQATHNGLWLNSTSEGTNTDSFRIKAAAIGRDAGQFTRLPSDGVVAIHDKITRYARPGLIEEYSVSVDGVRQDFLLLENPQGTGELELCLSVRGADIEAADDGVCLVLANSQRKISYSRLHVTDATGRELPARFEVAEVQNSAGDPALSIHVNDAGAVYPVRIDPTFSDANWNSLSTDSGPNGTVSTSVSDGAGNLYIGGTFTQVGGVTAHHVAKWDGSKWSALGTGTNDQVDALLFSNGILYAGGEFTTAGGVSANRIAQWNGTNWSSLGSGVNYSGNSKILALAAMNGEIYAGGIFSRAGDVYASSIAKWNGSEWSALDEGVILNIIGPTVGVVLSILASGDDLYVGGCFNQVGAQRKWCSSIAKWSDGEWDTIKSRDSIWDSPGFLYGVYVRTLSMFEGDLIAGGQFYCGVSENIGRWNGTNWSGMGVEIDAQVFALGIFQQSLHAASGGTVLKWTGSAWDPLNTSTSGSVWTLAEMNNSLYIGGAFSSTKGSNNFGKWNGSTLSAVGTGTDQKVNALAVSGTDLYVAGSFTSVNGRPANHIAKWNGVDWTALGSGVNGDVNALAVAGTNVYAGGEFTIAGDQAASNIAMWNGSEWSGLGVGTNAPVHALTAMGSELYAGGMFTNAGGTAANFIARWNGSQWSPVGSGTDSFVFALTQAGTDLVAAGSFYTAGGVDANFIAKWNGFAWSPLGSGISGNSFFSAVYALAVSGNTLYAGGNFSTAGGFPASHIAQWNGFGWAPLGAGAETPVTTLASSGNTLYAGGGFQIVGGISAKSVAKWQNGAWSDLGSGTDGSASALTVLGDQLCVGGDFSNAGGIDAENIATVTVEVVPVITSPLVAEARVGQAFSYQITAAYSPTSYAVSGSAPPVAPGGFGGFGGPALASLPAGLSLNPLSGLISGIPTAAGSFPINLSAINGAGAGQASLSLTILSASPSASWRQQYFGSSEITENSADLATPDGDGVSNLMKYALMLTPGSNASGSLPQALTSRSAEGSRLSLSFRRLPTRNDISIAIEAANSLDEPWTEIARSTLGAPFTGPAIITENIALDGVGHVQITDTVTSGSAPRRFMRIKVER